MNITQELKEGKVNPEIQEAENLIVLWQTKEGAVYIAHSRMADVDILGILSYAQALTFKGIEMFEDEDGDSEGTER